MTDSHQQIVEFARALREAGAVYVKLPDGLELTLAAKQEPLVIQGEKRYVEPEPTDPMEDPVTYGLPPGSQIPGFPKRRTERPDAEELDEVDE